MRSSIGGYTSSGRSSLCRRRLPLQSIDGSNKTRTNEPAIDELIDKLQATLDPEENVKVVTELSKAVNENCPQIPLYLRNNVRAYAKGLQGFNLNAGGNTFYEQMSWGEN